MRIEKLIGREVLDSRGNPTVEAELWLQGGGYGHAICPSGASTGKREARELRDGDATRYGGKGVRTAVRNIVEKIAPALATVDLGSQEDLDKRLVALDGTPDRSGLGGNAILPVSMAFARAIANSRGVPLHTQLGNGTVLPVPCMNVINGGAHADNSLDFQEFMIAPHNAPSFTEAIRMGEETFHALKAVLKKRGLSTGVGDEGGFAPNLKSNEEAIVVILEAITAAGYRPGVDISLCLDPAVSELWENGRYHLNRSGSGSMDSRELNAFWENWVRQYPIVALEDGMGEEDWEGWKLHTEALGQRIELIGDDLLCTNSAILSEAIKKGICNSILIKPNQVGTVTETLATMGLAKSSGYGRFISHRSGETDDTFIADLAVATAAGKIKTGGGCRGERIAKFNRLIRIEDELGSKATFAGRKAFLHSEKEAK